MKRISATQWLCFALLVPLLATEGCTHSSSDAASQTQPKVTTIIAQTEERASTIESFGNLAFRRKADLSASTEGTVKAVYLEEGDNVRQNQKLMELENVQIDIRITQALASLSQFRSARKLAQAKLREARFDIDAKLASFEKTKLQLDYKEAELTTLREELEDKKRLRELDGISASDLKAARMAVLGLETELATLKKEHDIRSIGLRREDIRAHGYSLPDTEEERREILRSINTATFSAELAVAEARVEAAHAELEAARALHATLSIHSPYEGIIGARYVEPGERVQPGTKLTTIFHSKELTAVFTVQEREAVLLKRGQPVEVTVASTGEMYRAAIELISPTVDPQSGNVRVKALLERRERSLRPGMFVRVRVIHGTPQQLVVLPATCIAGTPNERARVYTVVEGRVFAKELTVEKREGDNVLISDGISPGELIVDSPSPLLRDGERVRCDE